MRSACRCRRGGSRGSGSVAALVVIASTIGGAVIWMSGDVDRTVSLGATAQIVAFEAARRGAQQIDVDGLRRGHTDAVTLDPEAARRAADEWVRSELARRGLVGEVVEIVIDGAEVGVVVAIDHAGRRVDGGGRARAVIGP